MENIIISQHEIERFTKFKSNFEFANKSYNILQEHKGQYVAIADGSILGYAESRDKISRKYGHIEGVYIDLITDKNILWIL